LRSLIEQVHGGREPAHGLDEALPLRRSGWQRLLRRSMEALDRLPRGLGSAGAVGFILATGAYGVVEGGHAPAVLDAVTARSGFTIDAVRMTGHRETSDSAILAALSVEPGSSILAFDAAEGRERLMTLPWIASATVQKLYPDTLDVVVTERTPFARWFDGTRTALIARDGTLITDEAEALASYPDLPLVAGKGAAAQADAVLAMVAAFPPVDERLEAVVRVGDRRWDLVLEGGVTINLPEADPEAALAEVVRLAESEGLFARDIVVVDLRLADRIVVRLSPEAAERRRAELAKKPGQRKGAAT